MDRNSLKVGQVYHWVSPKQSSEIVSFDDENIIWRCCRTGEVYYNSYNIESLLRLVNNGSVIKLRYKQEFKLTPLKFI